jgi:hypothetical protein
VGSHAEDQIAIVPSDCIAIECVEAVEGLKRSLAQPHQIPLAHVNATIGRLFGTVITRFGSP